MCGTNIRRQCLLDILLQSKCVVQAFVDILLQSKKNSYKIHKVNKHPKWLNLKILNILILSDTIKIKV